MFVPWTRVVVSRLIAVPRIDVLPLTFVLTIVQLIVSGENIVNVVIDTSAIIAVIVAEPERDAIIAATSGHTLIGPGSIPWEIGNVFSAMIKQRRVHVADAQRALEILESIPVQYVNVDLSNVLSIAAQVNAYAYDAYFLDCALRHGTPLLTLDRTLGRAAGLLGVELVGLGG